MRYDMFAKPLQHVYKMYTQFQLIPLLFLIHINDLTNELISNPFIYADDTMLFEVFENADVSAANLNDDLNRISHWPSKWLVTMNPSKCRSLVFSFKVPMKQNFLRQISHCIGKIS